MGEDKNEHPSFRGGVPSTLYTILLVHLYFEFIKSM